MGSAAAKGWWGLQPYLRSMTARSWHVPRRVERCARAGLGSGPVRPWSDPPDGPPCATARTGSTARAGSKRSLERATHHRPGGPRSTPRGRSRRLAMGTETLVVLLPHVQHQQLGRGAVEVHDDEAVHRVLKVGIDAEGQELTAELDVFLHQDGQPLLVRLELRDTPGERLHVELAEGTRVRQRTRPLRQHAAEQGMPVFALTELRGDQLTRRLAVHRGYADGTKQRAVARASRQQVRDASPQ